MAALAIVTLIGLGYGVLVALAGWQERRQAEERRFREEFPAGAWIPRRAIDATGGGARGTETGTVRNPHPQPHSGTSDIRVRRE